MQSRGWKRLLAPAKLNLTLEVVGRRSDGYHEIRSVMLRLRRLADTLRIRIDEHGNGIRIVAASAGIPADASNLCHVAARRYLDHLGVRASVEIGIDKSVPVAAGLGGGSSDAASVLLAMNRHFRHAMPIRTLTTIAAEIGKDVPFFVSGAPACLVGGAGETLRRLALPVPGAFLVVNPGVEVGTREAYRALASGLRFMDDAARVDRTAAMTRALKGGDVDTIAARLYNDFEIVVEREHPEIKELKQALLAFGARGAAMSGSGPSVFGLFASRTALDHAETALRRHYPSFVIARG